MIEVDVDSQLPEREFFKNEKGDLTEQQIQYDWKLVLCKFCHKNGYSEEDCRKKNPPPPKSPKKQESRNVEADGSNIVNQITPNPTQEEGAQNKQHCTNSRRWKS